MGMGLMERDSAHGLDGNPQMPGLQDKGGVDSGLDERRGGRNGAEFEEGR